MNQHKPIPKQIISGLCVSFFIVAFGLLCCVNYMMWILDRDILSMAYKIAGCVLIFHAVLDFVYNVYRWSKE